MQSITAAASLSADAKNPRYQEIRSRIHQELLNRLNLERLSRVRREEAEPELRSLILTLLESEHETDILERLRKLGIQKAV